MGLISATWHCGILTCQQPPPIPCHAARSRLATSANCNMVPSTRESTRNGQNAGVKFLFCPRYKKKLPDAAKSDDRGSQVNVPQKATHQFFASLFA